MVSRSVVALEWIGVLCQYHFATQLNSEHPQLSGSVLLLVDGRGKMQDGFLRLDDIFNLNLPVDLAVLSACNTGARRSRAKASES